MSEQKRQALSAWMDAARAADLHEEALSLDSVLGDAEARAAWGRYHLIRDSLQGELAEGVPAGFADSVMAAIDAEPAIVAPVTPLSERPVVTVPDAVMPDNVIRRPWWQPAAGFAAAASVFAVVLLSWQNLQSPALPGQNAAVELASAPVAAAPVAEALPAQSVSTADEAERSRLEALLLNHTEAVSANGLNMVLPYARVVSDRIELPAAEAARALDADDDGQDVKADKPVAAPVEGQAQPSPAR